MDYRCTAAVITLIGIVLTILELISRDRRKLRKANFIYIPDIRYNDTWSD